MGSRKQFVVNHLGHFLLANRVIDLVTAAPQGRVVTLGSGNHRDPPPGGIQFDNLSIAHAGPVINSVPGRGFVVSRFT